MCGVAGWRGSSSGNMTLERRPAVTVGSASCRSKQTAQNQCFLTRDLGSSRERTGTGLRSRWLLSLRRQRVGFDLRRRGCEGGTRHEKLLGGRLCETSNRLEEKSKLKKNVDVSHFLIREKILLGRDRGHDKWKGLWKYNQCGRSLIVVTLAVSWNMPCCENQGLLVVVPLNHRMVHSR